MGLAIGTCCVGACQSTCCGCLSTPAAYAVSVSGVANSQCTNCTIYNTSHTIHTVVGFCEWRLFGLGFLCDGDINQAEVGMVCQAGTMLLEFLCNSDPPAAQYAKPLSSWTCLGSNVMTLASNRPFCTSWPASVTVIPV